MNSKAKAVYILYSPYWLVWQFFTDSVTLLATDMEHDTKPVFCRNQTKLRWWMFCRVYLVVATNADNRGLMVQQGCVKVHLKCHKVTLNQSAVNQISLSNSLSLMLKNNKRLWWRNLTSNQYDQWCWQVYQIAAWYSNTKNMINDNCDISLNFYNNSIVCDSSEPEQEDCTWL